MKKLKPLAAFLAAGTLVYAALRWAKKSGKLPLEM